MLLVHSGLLLGELETCPILWLLTMDDKLLIGSMQSSCSPMIVFFSLLGIACKLRVPEAHILLEIVRILYGKIGHIVWIVLCLINNIIAVANMLLGASATITAL